RSVRRRAVSIEAVSIEREETTEVALVARAEHNSVCYPYVEATPVRPLGWGDLLDTPTPIVAQMVEEIVAVEGPIHLDEVTVRVRCAWDLQRSGARIHSLV